jgi:hypothetical protein
VEGLPQEHTQGRQPHLKVKMMYRERI